MLYPSKRISFLITVFAVGCCLFLFLEAITLAETSAEWQPVAQRKEIQPIFQSDNKTVLFEGMPTLSISGNGKESANGCWSKSVPAWPEGFFEFRTHFCSEKVEEPSRSILARVIWLDDKGKSIDLPEYPQTLYTGDSAGWDTIQQKYLSPPGTASARLELIFRWDTDGSVFFGGTSFRNIPPPAPRDIVVGSIHYRPRGNNSSQENLEKFSGFINQAAEKGADIVCLPEGITLISTGKNYLEASEPVPGPTTGFMGRVAARHGIYIVANIYEREAEAVYNTSVLLDRLGRIAGKYRKVCLPREEIDGGLTPGDSFPVFDTDFGRIGLMTCWDVFFPEPARCLSAKGAEIIFMPIWGGNLDLAEARAIENQVYLVSSSYDMKTGVFDRDGILLAEGTETSPVALVKIDLNQRKIWPWLGDFRNRIAREKPPARATGKD